MKDINEIDDMGQWPDQYARGYVPARKFKAEHPSSRGLGLLNKLWDRIRPDLVQRGIVEVPTDLPSDLSKWAVLPDWVQKMVDHPFKGRNVFEWMDSWVPKGGTDFRGGAMTLRRNKDRSIARLKQFGQGMNDPRPAYTFHGDRMDFQGTKDRLVALQRKVSAANAYPDKDIEALDLESMDKWHSVLGGRCGSYVFAESSILFSGMTPHQETAAPIPWDVFWDSWRIAMDTQFPEAADRPPLQSKHLYVGVGQSLGIRIQNKEGAAGYPYSNMDLSQIQDALDKPKFKGRPNKGKVFQHAFGEAVKWLEAGMPMTGPLYDAMAQPATLTFRGDRAVSLDVRAMGVRGPQAKYHDAADQCAAINPSRSVIIVPTIQVLLQSLWAQPLGDHIAGSATPAFDWVDPWHSSNRLDELRRLDLSQGGQHPRASVGVDASGWDRDVTSQMHAGEAAWYCAMFPKEADLLYIDSPLPVVVGNEWVSDRLSSLQVGEEIKEEVTMMVDDGSTRVGFVTCRRVQFDYHDMICKVTTLVNDAPIAWADYEVDAPGERFSLAGAGPAFKDLSIVSNGGRRSGDGATGIGNSWSNVVITHAYCKMSQEPRFRKLIERRARLQGEAVGSPMILVDLLTRGDDEVIIIEQPQGGVPSESAASGICSVGLRANAKKQEASDVPGKPVFGFANVHVTENYMGKLMGRSMQRFMVQESMGLDAAALDLILEERGELELEAGLMTTTATAKSRLAPLAGYPLMDRHPAALEAIQIAVHHDKYRLSYIDESSFDSSGTITEEGKDLIAKAKQVEAKVQAKLRARRENVSVDLEALKEVYLAASVHDIIEEVALVDDYKPDTSLLLEGVTNSDLFRELTSQA